MLPFLIFLFLYQRMSAAQDPKTITAELGQDITLPCRVPNNNILAGVEWSRADLEQEYVLLLRNGHFVPDNQQPSFKDRVDLKERQMKNGDVSLILKKVTTNDTGTYECRILTKVKRSKRAVETIKVINLSVVDPPGQTGGHTEDGGKKDGGKEAGVNEDGSVGLKVGLPVSAVLLVVAAFGVVLIYKKQQRLALYQPPDEQQPV